MSQLPVHNSGIELQPHFPFTSSDYVAMSVSPLVYEQYQGTDGHDLIGFAGVGGENGQLTRVVRYRGAEGITAEQRILDWTRHITPSVLPETKDYPNEVVEEVVARLGEPEVLAAAVVELGNDPSFIMSYAARTALGETALDVKRELGIKEPKQPRRKSGIHYLYRKERQAYGTANYEAIVIGAVLLDKAFEPQAAIESGKTSRPGLDEAATA